MGFAEGGGGMCSAEAPRNVSKEGQEETEGKKIHTQSRQEKEEKRRDSEWECQGPPTNE